MKATKYDDVRLSRKDIMINNFIGGVFWAIGTIVGAGLVVGLLGLGISRLENVDLIGPLVIEIMEKIEEGKEKIG